MTPAGRAGEDDVAAVMQDSRKAIRDYLARERPAQDRFLAELVKVASDNPPGDCAPHPRRAAELLQ